MRGGSVFLRGLAVRAGEHGQIGYTRRTQVNQSSAERDVPLTTLDNPFPAGLLQPVGNSFGLLTGVGGNVNFIDQTKGAPRVHRSSIDIQRELRRHGPGGRVYRAEPAATWASADPATRQSTSIRSIRPWRSQRFRRATAGGDAAALRQSIPNPFFGIPEAGEFGTRRQSSAVNCCGHFRSSATSTCSSEPKADAGNITVWRSSSISGSPRASGASGAADSARLEQHQGQPVRREQRVPGSPGDAAELFDLEAEYGPANFDSPRRVILAPIVRIPGPAGEGLAYRLLGGWTASAIVELVSGSPLNAVLSSGASDQNLGLFGGRQRPNLIGDANTEGSDKDQVASVDHTNARWFNRTAFENPGVGQFGTAPRSIGDARYQFRKRIDMVLSKKVAIQGSHLAEVRFDPQRDQHAVVRGTRRELESWWIPRRSGPSRRRPGSCGSGS